jgi:tRNA pseudouridine65 synthase
MKSWSNPEEDEVPPSITSLEIIYETEDLIAINKPHGLLVHRSRMAADVQEFALQILRDQIGQPVWPAHRLDRKTSGVLLFTKRKAVNSVIQTIFQERQIKKVYKALVRGHMDEKGTIDYALSHESAPKEAVTNYSLIENFEIELKTTKFPTSRYSLIKVEPETGRFHQIRKHMKHISHPILGDRPHGCNKQNRIWLAKFGLEKMLLHAESLEFEYPEGNKVKIEAGMSEEFKRVLDIMKS